MKKENIIVFKKIAIQLFLLFFLFGCVPNKKVSKEKPILKKEMYQQVAEKRFGNQVEYRSNSDKNYILCEKKASDPAINPNQIVEFFVFDVQKEKIIYSDKIANAKLSWHSNTQLLISKQKGYIVNPTDTGKSTYIFDLKLKKKITTNKGK